MSDSSPAPVIRPDRFVWSADPSADRRNVHVLFVREFELGSAPAEARIALCADSRFVLKVNGHWAASGPGRFMPAHPRYQVWCLRRWLRAGVNRIEVVVNSPNTTTFQTDPAARGGFAAGGVVRAAGRSVSLATPGEWRCKVLSAWMSDAPAFSFALGPVEVCDTRVLRRELESRADLSPAVTVEGPWGEPGLAEVEPPDFRLCAPAAISGPVAWTKAENIFVFNLPWSGGRVARHALKTWVYAPRAGDHAFASLWLHPRVNGVAAQTEPDALRGARTNYIARFNEGWNLLTAYVDALTEFWTVQLAFTTDSGLEPSINRVRGDHEVVAVAGPLSEGQARGLESEAAADPAQWETSDLVWTPRESDLFSGAPARLMAWVTPDGEPPRFAASASAPSRLRIDRERGALLMLDWGGGFLGQLRVDVEAPAGTVMDVAWGETLRADGCLTLYPANPRIESADRFVLSGGRQEVEGFCVRGGRLVQLAFHLPEGEGGEVVVRHVAVRSMHTPLAETGRFACDDPLWNWVWRTGRATLQACMEDVYVDCPWRERGLYIADAWASARLQRLCSADHAISRHCLRLIAQGRLPDGQLNAVSPSWYQTALQDFSLTWILFLRDHWAWTGDVALVAELWPVVRGVLDSPVWRWSGPGLLDATSGRVFIDWGASPTAKSGRGNACLSAFHAEALRRAAELAEVIGREDEALEYRRRHERAREAFCTRLFDRAEGRFRCSLEEPEGAAADSIHANILALGFGLCASWQRERALAFVIAGLERLIADPMVPTLPRVELFFLNYALDVLYDEGRADVAERIVTACYGGMRERGAVTFWETLSRGSHAEGSQCHAWSGAAATACFARVIGLRPAVPGRTDHYRITPAMGALAWAECVFPHPRGEIRVRLVRDEDGVRATTSAPVGVELTVEGAEVRAGGAQFLASLGVSAGAATRS